MPVIGGSVGGVRAFTPRQYGAVGDGVTNDSVAFQAAANAAMAANAELWVEPGTYLVTNLVFGQSNTIALKVRGLQSPGFRFPVQTMPVTLKNAAGATTPIVTCFRGTELENIGFDGNATTSTNGAVYAVTAHEFRSKGVTIFNCAGTGLHIAGRFVLVR